MFCAVNIGAKNVVSYAFVLKQIHLLVKEQGLTLEGAARKLSSERKKVDARVKTLDSLKEIRRQLVEVRKSL